MSETSDILDCIVGVPSTASVRVVQRTVRSAVIRLAGHDHGIAVAMAEALLARPEVLYSAAVEGHPHARESDVRFRTDDSADPVHTWRVTADKLRARAEDSALWSLELEPGGDVSELPDGRASAATLLLYNAGYVWANVLRRALLGSVPVLAADEVTFRHNTSLLDDAQLTHRLGMIPFRLEDGRVPRPHQHSAFVNMKAYTQIDAPCVLTPVPSTEIQCESGNIRAAHSTDPRACFTVTHLAPGTGVDMIARLSVGTGTQHVRFSTVSCVGFKEHSTGFALRMEMVGQLRPSECVHAAFAAVTLSLSKCALVE